MTRALLLLLLCFTYSASAAEPRPRVVVSTDIDGTDPDDDQSMVHLLLYADVLELEGLISSPYGPGRKKDILEVIDCYARDYPRLVEHSSLYPAPDALRSITKQGALASPGPAGYGHPTEGSGWIVKCARAPDPRPLHVLVWGGMEDLAQALHDAPDILPRLRVYFIGGPNKTWSVDACHYVEQQHPRLWIIEANSTYRGWFVGGQQTGEWGNKEFVARHVAGHGALGGYFAPLLDGKLKMGDTPSVAWLLHGNPENPARPGWGGQFVRVWEGRRTVFDRLTAAGDKAPAFGIVEFVLPVSPEIPADHRTRMVFDKRIPMPGWLSDGAMRFRFSPRDAKVWNYVIESDYAPLNGRSGAFTAEEALPDKVREPSPLRPNWWTDDPDPANAGGAHRGAKTVSRWREAFLADFAARLQRCDAPVAR